MSLYEGMFVFPDTIREEELDEAAARVRAEIEKLGGTVQSLTRMGQRPFARMMGKRKSGHYVVSRFEMDGQQIPALREKLKLAGEVFRVQILCATPPAVNGETAAAKAGSDAVAQ
ncbi:MAG: 30S ribosomal protein S6 [Kiritimatiellia bacterium]|nr:30S ribosomal protein S6 [Kiritimatiellia bacterium]